MSYIELEIDINPPSEETNSILIAQLSELGFESFMENDHGFSAYIKSSKDLFVGKNTIEALFLPNGVKIECRFNEIEEKNWNEVWESNFEPIIVDNRCLVRASFHSNCPKTEYEIIIDPKMSFGTGHHQTTHLMINALLNSNMQSKAVLDMGCGTGVLAILAEMLGASNIMAIDNDEWAYQNALENILTNQCKKVEVLHGDANLLGKKSFDYILANINLNILLADIKKYVECLNPKGELIMSGILKTDIPTLEKAATNLGLAKKDTNFRDDWAMITFH